MNQPFATAPSHQPKVQDTILAIETATTACSVALWHDQKMTTLFTESPRAHSQSLIAMIDELLSNAACTARDLQFVAISQGPGAFTGIRIGAGVAKGIAFAQAIPIVPVCSLTVLAQTAVEKLSENDKASQPNIQMVASDQPIEISALLDARMGEVYAAQFRYDKANNQLTTLMPASVGALSAFNYSGQWVCGTAISEFQSEIIADGGLLTETIYPHAQSLIPLALSGRYHPVSASDYQPHYVRDQVTD